MGKRRWLKWIAEEAAKADFVMPWERAAKSDRRRVEPETDEERLLDAG